MESPPAKDRHPNHQDTPQTGQIVASALAESSPLKNRYGVQNSPDALVAAAAGQRRDRKAFRSSEACTDST